MRVKSAPLILLLLLGLLSAGRAVSIAQTAGGNLVEAAGAESTGARAYVALDDVSAFSTEGGDALFEPGTSSEETFSYDTVDAAAGRLVGLTRPAPLAHETGAFVTTALSSTPAPAPTTSPEESAAAEPDETSPAEAEAGGAESDEPAEAGPVPIVPPVEVGDVPAAVGAALDPCGSLCGTGAAELELAANLADDLIDEMLLTALSAGILVPDTSACGTAPVCMVPLGEQFYDCGSGWQAPAAGCKYHKFKIVGGCDNQQCTTVTVDLRWRGGTANVYPCNPAGGSGIDEWKERNMKLVRTSDKNVKWQYGQGSHKVNTCVDDYQTSSPNLTISTDHLAVFKWRHMDSGKVDDQVCSGCSFNSTARYLIAVR